MPVEDAPVKRLGGWDAIAARGTLEPGTQDDTQGDRLLTKAIRERVGILLEIRRQ